MNSILSSATVAFTLLLAGPSASKECPPPDGEVATPVANRCEPKVPVTDTPTGLVDQVDLKSAPRSGIPVCNADEKPVLVADDNIEASSSQTVQKNEQYKETFACVPVNNKSLK